ncbi:MAG: PaaI family thioesterase [Deltaproteobacteria bacterium]|nr:PaaI family thioesterase [Deltaproteobacteria bacterium]
MPAKIEPITQELETAIRRRLEHNPFVQFMGIQVPELGMGYARFVLQVRPEFHNSQGFLQGGVITALADEAVAYALFSTVPEGEMINTVEMKINFLAPVKEGEIEARAHISKRGRTISLGEVTVRQGERLVAKGMCTYIHQKAVSSEQ